MKKLCPCASLGLVRSSRRRRPVLAWSADDQGRLPATPDSQDGRRRLQLYISLSGNESNYNSTGPRTCELVGPNDWSDQGDALPVRLGTAADDHVVCSNAASPGSAWSSRTSYVTGPLSATHMDAAVGSIHVSSAAVPAATGAIAWSTSGPDQSRRDSQVVVRLVATDEMYQLSRRRRSCESGSAADDLDRRRDHASTAPPCSR